MAILVADVVNFSGLMAADGEGALAQLKALRSELIDPTVARYRGRIFKTIGDALVIGFSSVVEAVRCGVTMQREMMTRRRNAMQFRVGVHVGEVIIDGEDIYSDDVYLAVRLEGLAAPGGICISARVFEDVVGRVEAEFDDGGEQRVRLKKIDRPVRVYQVRDLGLHAAPAPAQTTGSNIRPAPRITISYRRDDSLDVTGRIFDRLAAHFGRAAVFRDIDNIPPGVDFRCHVDKVLEDSDIILAIVGPRWLGPDGDHWRIGDAADPVRVEVETALRKTKRMIPVLVSHAEMPRPNELPESLQDFAYRNAVRVDSGPDFEFHIGRLIRAMEGVPVAR
jgi:class 3 adenylate cyclase